MRSACLAPLRSDFSSIFICVSGGDEMAILRSGEHGRSKERRREEGNESAAAAIDVVDSEDTMTGTASRGQTNRVTLNFPPLLQRIPPDEIDCEEMLVQIHLHNANDSKSLERLRGPRLARGRGDCDLKSANGPMPFTNSNQRPPRVQFESSKY